MGRLAAWSGWNEDRPIRKLRTMTTTTTTPKEHVARLVLQQQLDEKQDQITAAVPRVSQSSTLANKKHGRRTKSRSSSYNVVYGKGMILWPSDWLMGIDARFLTD